MVYSSRRTKGYVTISRIICYIAHTGHKNHTYSNVHICLMLSWPVKSVFCNLVWKKFSSKLCQLERSKSVNTRITNVVLYILIQTLLITFASKKCKLLVYIVHLILNSLTWYYTVNTWYWNMYISYWTMYIYHWTVNMWYRTVYLYNWYWTAYTV